MTLRTALLIMALLIGATGFSQSISISKKDVSLSSVLKEIEKQTEYRFFYKQQLLKNTGKISIDVKNASIESVLAHCFSNQPIDYKILSNKQIVLSPKPANEKASPGSNVEPDNTNPGLIMVSGFVSGANGQPLSNATIKVRGKNIQTLSDEKGAFSIMANPDGYLQISYVGHNSVQEKVKAGGGLIIKLEPNAVLEDAVVYNGYQTIKQKYLTGAVTSLKMDSIMQPGLNTVDKMLEGRVPGMMFLQNSGQAGAAPKLRIRGTNTYLGSREPLWVVDGIVRTNPFPIPAERINDPDFVNLLGNAISGLNPYDIEQIDVLKDATAAALYGVRAANGVIVITTKRGKPGPPTVNYNVTTTFTQRPRYSDRSMYMMNSAERVDVSREMIQKQLQLRGGTLEAYEKALVDYYDGKLDYETFKKEVGKAESVNTDWLGNTMRDVFATNHTLSVSGGSIAASYRASVGYRTEPGVIKKEGNDLYTGMLNLQLNYRKFKAEFNVQLNKEKRKYTPAEIGLMNYAYGTSRAIPLYNEDGSLYFYSNIQSNPFYNGFNDFRTMNIVNEMNHTGETIQNNEYNASVDLSYEIAKGIQFNSKLAYTGGNSAHETWFEGNSEWAMQLRNSAYNNTLGVFEPQADPMPFGGELRQQLIRRQNYIINGRLNFSRYLDQQEKHQLTVEAAIDLNSNRNNSVNVTNRGYYPERGHSFAIVDPSKYTSYAYWLSRESLPVITEVLQNSMRSYLTSTYIFKESYVVTATVSQEFSNSFGSRSNEKFLPTWALSGRWNLDNNLLSHVSWLDQASLVGSFGTRGNMLPGQTPYTIFQKGAVNSYYDELVSNIVSFPNPNLAWEKTQDYNASLQFSILKGRINGSMGYFYSKTTNAFMEKKVSAVNGAPSNSYVVNGGTLQNQGIELSMNFKIIDNIGTGNKKGFMWRFDPQLGQVFNKLLNNNVNSRNVLVDAASLTFRDFLNGVVPVNGKSVNTFYAYRFKGLDPNVGFPVFYGAEPENKTALKEAYNKMTREEVFSMVMVEAGRREPVLQGAVNNSFTYGNWTLNVTFSYSFGNKIRLLQIASGNYGTFRPSSQQNLRKEFINRWRYPGDEKNTNIPAIQGADALQVDQYAWWLNEMDASKFFATDYYQMYDFSDLRVVKGDYLKLQYVSLSYRFPNELCRKLHCKGALVHFSGTNLFTITNKALRGQDPTQSGSAPNINLSIRPVYALNLNLSF
ncbi:SusC/RagA family TonB-linked outer membrane protein [Pseudoflavitalea rhizosphaerae]|uniref:SusC/RagA family TonB-linked outer membrane protein n=1 Tax=Pseudoflavitalea rhizosphaerae TaxID=1884793 RepID=UPI000F8E086D|nr:SusC/RagA family TonB-linked outer membrane protein [Pseudoflavitalea rhizosphaerae]